MMQPVLAMLADNQEHPVTQIRERLAEHFQAAAIEFGKLNAVIDPELPNRGPQFARQHRILFTHGCGDRLEIVIGVAGIPYKCPPAPVEFAFLLDDYLRARGIRDETEVKLLSPLNRAFTIEATSKLVQPILAERGIDLTGFFNVESVDPLKQTVTSLEGETMSYDLLILVPPHRGQQVIETSDLGDERGWVPVDKNTLKHTKFTDIWAIGDATNIPISKSGSVAHYEATVAAAERGF